MVDRWRWEPASGDPEVLVGATVPDPAERLVRVVEPPGRVFVLGSTQPDPGPGPVRTVRRRSGGGGVLVEPGGLVWVDLVVPRGDPWWDDDVGRAARPVGRAWQAALRGLGIDAVLHQGPLVDRRFSRRICFAGLGPGELTVDGRKALGVAQRRTRAGACFQCALALRPPDRETVAAAGLTGREAREAAAELAATAGAVAADPAAVLAALEGVLPG